MQEKINLKSNNCHYPECIHYEEGKCLDDDARKNCLEFALAVLCLNEDDLANERRL